MLTFYFYKMAPIEMAPQRLGNTKAKRWQLTLNDCGRYEELIEYLIGLKSMKYLISCKEKAPTTGHEHIHIYICFSGSISLSVKKLCGAHIEACRGTHKANIDYIRKDGDILDEIGEEPRERGGSHTVKELKAINDPDELDYKEYNTWNKIHEKEAANIDIEELAKKVRVYYIQGPPGIGKTERMKSIVRELKSQYGSKINMLKYENGFWIGVGSAKIAVYDDFRDSHMKASEFINFIDYNKHYMNIKGGTKLNDYELIIITSIQKLNEIYRNFPEEGRNQWTRRMELINMYNENDDIENNDLDIDEL